MSGPTTPPPLDQSYVFDTSPLSSSSCVGRLDLLEALYAGRALWTIEVRDETRRGVRARTSPSGRPGRDLDADADPDDRCSWASRASRRTRPSTERDCDVRWALSGRLDDARRHLGEAATIVVAQREGAVAVLDDADARRHARATSVRFVGTITILQAAASRGLVTGDEAWVIVQQLMAQGRGVRPRVARSWFDL